MKIYIRSAAAISPQQTFGNVPTLACLEQPVEFVSNILPAVEPDYKDFIDAKLIRRMSRIIRMGVAAALQCLRQAGEENAGAVVTGTAYGCLEDTGIFLTRLIEQNEEMLSPTQFVQSTHNTIGAQIALILQCTQYNNTFVHKAFSFESALLDSMMLLRENTASTVLVGGIDEITKTSFAILNRFGLYKAEAMSNLKLISSKTKGTIAGEGTAFFLLSNQPSEYDYAELQAINTFYKPVGIKEIEENIENFLSANHLTVEDIDIIISGRNGDSRYEEVYNILEEGIFKNAKTLYYKHLCGEYPTSISFALWMAANMLKKQKPGGDANKINNILIYNNHQNKQHSLLLLSYC